MAVDETAQKPQPFSYVPAVVPKVVLGHVPIGCQKLRHAGRVGEKIGRMTELRGLHQYSRFTIENVFRTKEIDSTSTPAELFVEKGIVVWLPRNQSDVKIARDA
jgi:hypothetical protein